MDSQLTITLIQSNLHWEDREKNLLMFDQKIRSIRERTELIILPEMFSTGFSMKPEQLAETMEGETVKWMKKTSADKNAVITGSVIIQDKDKFYNRLLWILPNGQYGYYDKRHLFAYADEHLHYTPGNKRLIGSLKGWKISLQVCYDLRFPVWSRNRLKDTDDGSRPEYDLIVYVANWPDRRRHAWLTLLQARAIENQCYAVGVNRMGTDGKNIYHTGDSLVADPLGELLYHKKDEEDVHTITLEREKLMNIREKLPFWKDGDRFEII